MVWLRRLIKNQLLKRGVVISRPPGQFNVGLHKLLAVRNRGLRVDCAVDGGAAEGVWAREFKSAYPQAQLLCVEPRADVQQALHQLANELGRMHIAPVLLGASDGQAMFGEALNQSAVLSEGAERFPGRVVQVPMTTLDRLIEQRGLPWPDLIKLDLQGFELKALRGAPQCLKHAQALLMEVSFIRLQSGDPDAHETICFMKDHGFVIYDIPALWHRPLDGALAQGDFLFLKASHPLLGDTRWSAEAQSSDALS